ncbi:hypothetical protein HG530_013570 [Fusarium avenaceum]|nr:hypothetical protein HG530_013570 [Fusarium avenaceum]
MIRATSVAHVLVGCAGVHAAIVKLWPVVHKTILKSVLYSKRGQILSTRGRLRLSGTGSIRSLGSVLLDDFLNTLLGLVPILCIQLDQIDTVHLGNLTQGIVTLLIVNEADADTDTAKSASSANTVQVSLGVRFGIAASLHGDVIVDNHGHTGNIDTTCQNVGGNKDLVLTLAEFGQKVVSLRSIECGVKGRDLVPVCNHSSLNLIGAFSSLDRIRI